jgi:hypothetical protein
MKTPKKGWPSAGEAGEYRQKAREAERAAGTAATAEAKKFYQELAKTYYMMADSAEAESDEQ